MCGGDRRYGRVCRRTGSLIHHRREYHRGRRNECLNARGASTLPNINRISEEERFMSNQVVLITGALTGIGRATAIAFAEAGATVVISGRHPDEGQKLAAELRTLRANAEFVQADVRRESDVRNLVDHIVSRFGRLDAAINNAGTEGKPGPFTDQTAESYAATFDTNVLGTLLSMKHQLRVMLPP